MIRAREERPALAVGLSLSTYVAFSCIDTSAKWLIEAAMPVAVVVFVRYFGHLIMVALVAGVSEGRDLFRMRKPGLTLVRGTMLVAATFANFTALQYLPMTVTTSIFFISPLIITAMAALFLKERVGPRRWAAVVVGLLGVLVITRPWGASFHWAMLVSLIPPTASAVYTLITRRLAGVESPDTMQFYAALIPVVVLAPFALGDWTWPEGPVSWAAFVLIGVFGWLGHQIFTLAHRFAGAATLAPITYTHIIWISLASWLVFNQPPDFWTVIGAGIIIASGLYVWLRERRLGAA